MSYTKKTFKNGDVLLASDLNDMGEGIESKQDQLVDGVNIKTINNESLLGEGNIELPTLEQVKKATYVVSLTTKIYGGVDSTTLSSDEINNLALDNEPKCRIIAIKCPLNNTTDIIYLNYVHSISGVFSYQGYHINKDTLSLVVYRGAFIRTTGKFTVATKKYTISDITETKVNELIDAKITAAIDSDY